MSVSNPHRLRFVGPRDGGHGFPLFYEDEFGTRLALAVNNDPNTPAIGELPHPGQPQVFPSNFPDEAFYFLAESRMTIGGAGQTGRARLILALEAAFGGTGAPGPAAHVVFSRIRVRLDDVIPGAEYVVTHPYGQTAILTADENGRVFDTEDRGLADEQFSAVLAAGLVAPFLRWSGGAPVGYLGDGVTERTVTGSPFDTNFFRVDGPSVGEAGGPVDPLDVNNLDRIQSPLFTVQGRLATQVGVEVTASTYTRSGATTVIDLHATSAPGQQLELAAVGLPRVGFGARDRDYTARTEVPSPAATAEVVNVTDSSVSRSSRAVVDRVDIDQAEFSPSAQTLTVAASSSDDLGPALEVVGFGAMTQDPQVFGGVDAVPAEIAVVSAAGGRAVRPVALVGPGAPSLPVVADAGPDLDVFPGSPVELDGSGSRGPITALAWTQTLGSVVVLSDATLANPTFTTSVPEDLGFTVTVQGLGGPSSDDVLVHVHPTPPPDQITVQRAQFRTDRQQFRVGGTLTGTLPNTVVVRLAGVDLGESSVDAAGAWDVRRTLTAAEPALRPNVGDDVEIASSHGGSALAEVNIRN